jgi:hypothetical protein
MIVIAPVTRRPLRISIDRHDAVWPFMVTSYSFVSGIFFALSLEITSLLLLQQFSSSNNRPVSPSSKRWMLTTTVNSFSIFCFKKSQTFEAWPLMFLKFFVCKMVKTRNKFRAQFGLMFFFFSFCWWFLCSVYLYILLRCVKQRHLNVSVARQKKKQGEMPG